MLLSYGQTILSTLISLTYTPVMLRLLGQSEYGLYTLVNGFVSNLSLLSFGMGSAYSLLFPRGGAGRRGRRGADQRHVYDDLLRHQPAVPADRRRAGRQRQNIFAAKLTAKELDTAKILMALLVVNIAASFPASVFFSYITAKERFLFQRLVGMLRTVLNPIVMLPLLLMGYGSIALVLVTLILTAISDAVSIWYCVKKAPHAHHLRQVRFWAAARHGGASFFIFLNEIINQINWTVDTTLLGIISGTAATAIYGVGAQINSVLHGAVHVDLRRVHPADQPHRRARGGDEAAHAAVYARRAIQFMLLMLVLTGFIFVGMPFIQAWGGAEYARPIGLRYCSSAR